MSEKELREAITMSKIRAFDAALQERGFGWPLDKVEKILTIASRTLSPSPERQMMTDEDRNAVIDECVAVAEGCRMVGRDPIGPLHGAGWNGAQSHIVKSIAAIKRAAAGEGK